MIETDVEMKENMISNNIKLSNLFGKEDELTECQIDNIIFQGIKDEFVFCKYAIIFGSPDYQEHRVKEAVRLYKDKRAKKLIFMGGIGRETEISKRNETEAIQMKRMALERGVLEEDIIIEDKSTTTIENCLNVATILEKELKDLKDIILVSSEWHLKRCLAIAMKYISPDIRYSFGIANDGIADRENWKKSEQGHRIVLREIAILAKHAKQERIYDLDIILDKIN